jgi:hypothetical protein
VQRSVTSATHAKNLLTAAGENTQLLAETIAGIFIQSRLTSVIKGVPLSRLDLT